MSGAPKKSRVRRGPANKEREASPHLSTENLPKAKVTVLEEYWNYDSMRIIPITNATMERLIAEGIKWARTDPDGIKVNQFLDINGIARTTWDDWRKKYDIIKRGNLTILSILGNKRELNMLTRKFDSGSTMRMMTHYDTDWKENEEWRASLTNKADSDGGNVQYIVIPEVRVPNKGEK